MTRSRNLVTFADDGSAGADVAWLWLNNHGWPGWAVEVLMVRPVTAGPPPGPEAAQPHPWQPDSPRRVFAESGLGEAVHLAADGDPRAVLGARTSTDLLVVGARGRGVWKALHLGSTTEWLLQCPPAPLVVVRRAGRTGRVLACVDGSPHAARAVRTLAGLPWLGRCSVTVLGVVEHDRDPAAAVEAAAGALSDRAAEVVTLLRAPGPMDVFGNVRVDLFDVMGSLAPDLVVLGTRGLTGLRRLRLGSTASAVAHHAPCTVLLAREPVDDDRHGDL
jgi:nucleotide-binding universal stress UspA family protein